MRVLSLFDGISVARVGIERAGIHIDKYWASEIESPAMAIAKRAYPDTQLVGDVTKLRAEWFSNVDLIIGGSPCQDISRANMQGVGLNGVKSRLFWEYVRLIREVKPRYFILENVFSMNDESKRIITRALGVRPVMLDAAYVSAQKRQRLFWTNVRVSPPTSMSTMVIRDILENRNGTKLASSLIRDRVTIHRAYAYGGRCNLKSIHEKSPTCITYVDTQRLGTMWFLFANGTCRPPTPIEYERLQSLPDGYTRMYSDAIRYRCIGNAFNANIIAHIMRHI